MDCTLDVHIYARTSKSRRTTGIVNEERRVTAETAVLLGHYFGTSPDMWMNLQTRYDLRVAEREAAAHLRTLPRCNTAA